MANFPGKISIYTLFLGWMGLLLSSGGIWAAPVSTDHARVELVAEHQAIKPGVPFQVAFRMELERGWHTYWKNAGDSGLPLTLDWDLPEGFSAGEIQWPFPEIIELPPYRNYGYHDQLTVLVTLMPPDSLTPGDPVALRAHANWLICKDICLPEQADVGLGLPVTDQPPPFSHWRDIFVETRAKLPQPWSGASIQARVKNNMITLAFDNTALQRPFFFSADEGVIEYAAEQDWRTGHGGGLLELRPSSYADKVADRLRGVLVDLDSNPVRAWEIDQAVLPTVSQPGSTAPSDPSAGTAPRPERISLGIAVLFAFIGGLILNLMPCVFPVLSIKVLSFVNKARDDSGSLRQHGLLFAAGVLVSFWGLLLLLLVLRGLGEQLGWGFQLQSPWFVALMALLMFTIGLNLLGVFETGLGLARAGGNVDPGTGYSGSFFTGVLATVVASPCTAPFMGVAIGYAISQNPAVASLIFTSLGLGMAAPYLILLEFPALLRRLPRPGPWMDTLKQVLAVPMFLTAIWLLWVLGRQLGVDALAIVLVVMLALGAIAWYYGRRQSRGSPGRRPVFVILVISGLVVLSGLQGISLFAPAGVSPPTAEWIPYQEEKLAQLRSEGKNIFVDFTAAWCITCQVNKRVAINHPAVVERLDQLDVVRMRGDWTNRDPEITRALEYHGRSGVPLNLYYSGGGKAVVLPAILTPKAVLEIVTP